MPVVRVRYLGMLQRLAGVREDLLEVPSGGTVRTVLDEAGRRHGPALAGLLLEESVDPGGILISVDGEACHDLGTPLPDGARVMVVMLSPMMVGGAGCAG